MTKTKIRMSNENQKTKLENWETSSSDDPDCPPRLLFDFLFLIFEFPWTFGFGLSGFSARRVPFCPAAELLRSSLPVGGEDFYDRGELPPLPEVKSRSLRGRFHGAV